MNKIISFLRWEFRGCTRSAGFWGIIIILLGAIMFATGCPRPWPFYTVMLGFLINLADCVYSFVRFRISMYKFEQESIARKLKEK